MKVYFHFLSGTRKDQVIELELPVGQTKTIGRDPASDLSFNLDFEYPVSRRHATIQNDGGRIVLRDVGSSLGTQVQGKPVKGCVLKSKYRIQFGGELGPLCRFYKAVDLKRCPLCQGPLFKSNFTCIFCERKVCYSHFDESFKCCGACADQKRRALAGHVARQEPVRDGGTRGDHVAPAASALPPLPPLPAARVTQPVGQAYGAAPPAPAPAPSPGARRTQIARAVCGRCGGATRPGAALCRHCAGG